MPSLTLVHELFFLLIVIGGPAALFAGIGRASVPARERTPITRWDWKDLYGNITQGLHQCSQDSPLTRLMEKAPPDTADDRTSSPEREGS